MRSVLAALGSSLLLAAPAVCQNLVQIPPHSSVYNGFSRGFNFTAQTTFVISQLNLPLNAFQAGDTAAYLVRINGTQVLHSVGNAGAINTNILVNNGDVVDIIGNWSPAAPTNFTAHNSYGSSAPYATTIEGVPHTLNRTGWQWDIGDPAFQGTYLAPTTGSLGRIEMYTSPAAGFASYAPYGTGCYDRPRMVYEQFAGGTTPDLMNTAQTMIYQPNANGGNYIIVQGGAPYDAVTAAANGVDLLTQTYTSTASASWDDASIVMTLPAATFPTGFPFPGAGGGSTTTITINSNGKIYLGSTTDASFATNGSNYASLAPFQGTTGAGLPVLSPFNVDLDPTVGGNIWYEAASPGGGVRITWAGVPNWQDPAGPTAVINDIQLELLPSGQVNFAYGPSLGTGGSANNDAIVGFSAGGGQPIGAQVDWSAINSYVTGDGATPIVLDASARPVLGTTINLTLSNIPSGSIIGAVVLGLTKYDPGIDLTSVGMPGCFLYSSQDSVALAITPGATYSRPLALPNVPAFAGARLASQGAVLNPSIPNALNAISSNGVELLIDVN